MGCACLRSVWPRKKGVGRSASEQLIAHRPLSCCCPPHLTTLWNAVRDDERNEQVETNRSRPGAIVHSCLLARATHTHTHNTRCSFVLCGKSPSGCRLFCCRRNIRARPSTPQTFSLKEVICLSPAHAPHFLNNLSYKYSFVFFPVQTRSSASRVLFIFTRRTDDAVAIVVNHRTMMRARKALGSCSFFLCFVFCVCVGRARFLEGAVSFLIVLHGIWSV